MNPNFVIEPTHVIQRQLWELTGTGPASYNPTTGDLLNLPNTQYPSCVPGGFLSASGNYELKPFPSPSTVANIRCNWAFKWFYSGAGGPGGATGVTAATFTAGTGGTNGTAIVAATGGGGSGATVSVVTAGGAITSVTVVNPGIGYTSAPTFTPAAGSGTITASIGLLAGQEVPSGTNLSAESVQFFVIGGEM